MKKGRKFVVATHIMPDGTTDVFPLYWEWLDGRCCDSTHKLVAEKHFKAWQKADDSVVGYRILDVDEENARIAKEHADARAKTDAQAKAVA